MIPLFLADAERPCVFSLSGSLLNTKPALLLLGSFQNDLGASVGIDEQRTLNSIMSVISLSLSLGTIQCHLIIYTPLSSANEGNPQMPPVLKCNGVKPSPVITPISSIGKYRALSLTVSLPQLNILFTLRYSDSMSRRKSVFLIRHTDMTA